MHGESLVAISNEQQVRSFALEFEERSSCQPIESFSAYHLACWLDGLEVP
jgi:hypothetical protein